MESDKNSLGKDITSAPPNITNQLQYDVWYRSDWATNKDPINGPLNGLLSGIKQGVAVLTPGLLTVIDRASNQEAYSLKLTSDIQCEYALGRAFITYMNGQKVIGDSRYGLLFQNPFVIAAAFRAPIPTPGNRKAKHFVKDCMQAAGSTGYKQLMLKHRKRAALSAVAGIAILAAPILLFLAVAK